MSGKERYFKIMLLATALICAILINFSKIYRIIIHTDTSYYRNVKTLSVAIEEFDRAIN